ncbi:ATP-binding protein [Bdellovibrionota bacterium FG-2]
MDILGQTALMLGVTSFALGFSVLARNVRNKLFIVFAILTTLVSGWALCFFFEKIWEGGSFYRAHLIFNVWLAPAALGLIQILVRIHDRVSRTIFDFSVLFALGLSAVAILRLDNAVPWLLNLIHASSFLIVVQVLNLMWIDKRLRNGIRRLPKLPTVGFARRNLVYAGGLFVLCSSVMDHVPLLGKLIPSLGNIGLMIYLFFVSQAITQQRLLNFGALLSRLLVLLAVALTLTGVYSLLVAWIQDSPGLFFLNSFIASFLILMLLDPLRALVGYFTRRLLTQKHLRVEQILRESQRKLPGIVDLGSLFHTILLTVEQVLQPQWGALFVLRSDGTRFRRVRTLGQEPQGELSLIKSDAPKEVMVTNLLLQHCEKLRKKGELPVLLDQMLESELDRSASRAQREQFAGLLQGLKALNANLLIPFYAAEKNLGFVSLRIPAPPEPWGNNWGLLPIVYPFFEQVAQAMKSMEVFVRQREKERLAEIGAMAAGLAHEIRNPLGAIKGAAQFLDPSIERPESQFLKVIIEEVDRLNRVVSQFLDYSKPHSAEFKPTALFALVHKTMDFLRTSLPPGLVLELGPAPERDQVEAASEQIQQVLINLIQNSAKAVEDRADPLVKVGVEYVKDASEITLWVEDNGKGIKREHLDKIFIPFFTTSPSGTGLGLSICQKIAEAHRGRMEVASEEGRFTRFSMVLPALKG